MTYTYYILIFCLGLLFGFLVKSLLEQRKRSSGSIMVSKNEGKTLYSLELNDDPGKIEFKKKVVFNVVPDEESHRK